MGHPLIEEFCRAHDFRPDFLRRCQRVFREEVQPQFDERDALLVENADLKAKLKTLSEKAERKRSEAAA